MLKHQQDFHAVAGSLIGHLRQLIGLAHAVAMHIMQAVGRAAQTQSGQASQRAKRKPEGDDDAAEVLNDFDVLEHVQPVICLQGQAGKNVTKPCYWFDAPPKDRPGQSCSTSRSIRALSPPQSQRRHKAKSHREGGFVA
jgi:hypothetical protein